MDLFQQPQPGSSSSAKVILEVLIALIVVIVGFLLFRNYQPTANAPSALGTRPPDTYTATPAPTPTPSTNPIDTYVNPFK